MVNYIQTIQYQIEGNWNAEAAPFW